jgi:hypothetical protein
LEGVPQLLQFGPVPVVSPGLLRFGLRFRLRLGRRRFGQRERRLGLVDRFGTRLWVEGVRRRQRGLFFDGFEVHRRQIRERLGLRRLYRRFG